MKTKPHDRLTQSGPIPSSSRHAPIPEALRDPHGMIGHERMIRGAGGMETKPIVPAYVEPKIVRCPGGHPTAAGSVRCQVCSVVMPK